MKQNYPGHATSVSFLGDTTSSRRAVLICALINTLEGYDFIVYIMLSEYIIRIFLPFQNKSNTIIAAFILFGASFIARPLGGITIGWFGDAIGRKPALLLSIGIMATATTAIGLLPGHASLGIAAPACLLVARLAQGFSVGGEWAAAISFMSEWSTTSQRGFHMSFLSLTVAVGSLIASGITAILITLLSSTQILEWGWRIPFLLGGVAGLLMFWLRYYADETPLFRVRRASASFQRARLDSSNLNKLLLTAGFTVHWTVCYYIFLIYFPVFVRTYAEINPSQAMWSNTVAIISVALLIPIAGAISDKLGRRPLLKMSCVAVIAFAIPAFWAVAVFRNLTTVILVQLTLGAAIALYSGPGPAVLAELFPTETRSIGVGLSYALTTTIFGGFAPFIADWSIMLTGCIYMPALYAMAAAGVSLAAISLLPETATTQLT